MTATATEEPRLSAEVARSMHRFSRWSGAAAAAIGVAVLAGWATDSDLLRAFLPGQVSAKPNTALALVLAGVAQALGVAPRRPWLRWLRPALAAVVGGFGLLTLLEYAAGADLGIDRVLFPEPPGTVGTVFPGRMAALTALEFALYAVTVALRSWRTRGAEILAQHAALAGAVAAALAMLGYTFNARSLYALGWGTSIALPTSLALILLFGGTLCAQPEVGWMAVVAGERAGGVLLRRLLPAAIAGPWFIGWVTLAGSTAGFYGPNADNVLAVLSVILLFSGLLYTSANVLDRLDREREARKNEVDALNRELESRVQRRTEELLAANDQLRAKQLYVRSLIESSIDALATIDAAGNITDVNQQMEALTGSPRGELMGTPFKDHFTEPARAEEGVQLVLRQGRVSDYELSARHREGRETPVAYNASTFFDPQGKLMGVFAAARDITERKRAELELRRLNRALRALSRCTNAVARASDEPTLLQRVCDIIVQVGGYPLAWVGYAEDDADKTVTAVAVGGAGAAYVRNARITWGDTERGRGPTGTALRTGQPCYVGDIVADPRFTPWRENAVRHGWASVLAVPLKEDGHAFGALNLYAPEPNAFDAEEQKLMWELAANLSHGILALRTREERDRAESELRLLNETLERRVAERTSELAASNAELESFSYSVSHDLRAPLRHIHGFSKVLLDQHSDGLDDQARHYLQRVRNATQQMGRVVDDLLNLSRIGRQALRREPAALDEVVRKIAAELQADAGERAIEWRIGELPEVACDIGLIRQVLFNLLSNAVKFTRDRCPAIIEVGRQGGELFVRDNGVGFDPKYADKLFGVFQRLHRSEEFEGTGVGLATVRRILRKHGGDIRVDAVPDGGATFYFTIGEHQVSAGHHSEVIHAA